MNFFDAQDKARRTTRRLVFLFILATILIVAGVTGTVGVAMFNFTNAGYGVSGADFIAQQAPLLAGTAILSALFILGASLYKTSRLSSGGGRVAVDMGGTLVSADIRDPLRQRLRNVVEELSIASGVPVPEIYVLEAESSINAFAAGYAPGDAAVAVTRGTLELLDRDELQGVIGHEFSHILNGDMRLNIRIMGVLFGILALGLIGRMIIRGGHHASLVSSRRGRGAPVVLIVGLGLALLGAVGVFMGRIIKAGVSRQREYLADASAVQLTRQNMGLANALKKIGGYSRGSLIRSTDPEEVSHMLFGAGARLSGLLATHPPLADRIRALDPTFKESDFPVIDQRLELAVIDGANIERSAAGLTSALAVGGTVALSKSIADMVGHPENQHVEFASHLRQSLPESLYGAAHSSEFAYLLAIALILDRSGRIIERQLVLAEERLGQQRTHLLRRYYDELARTGAEFRLPLLEIAFPALKLRPAPQLTYLIELAGRMIEIDGEVDLYEYCFYRMLVGSLGQAINPSGRRSGTRAAHKEVRRAAVNLLTIIANYGHETDAESEQAYRAGLVAFGNWALSSEPRSNRNYSVSSLDQSLDVLLALNSKGKKMLLEAISTVVLFDGKLTVTETELIRAICATLDCPLPPILVEKMAV